MDPFFIKAIQLLLSLSLLIILHELGHFIPAKLFKTRVEKFFLFFDVKFALFKKKIGETVYGIGWLPLGGYVKIAGMIDESMDKEQMAQPEQPWEFRSKPAWQRLIIMIGGVTVNVIVGFLIYAMILFTWGSGYVAKEDMPNGFSVSEHLKSLGFEDGDKILMVNGKDFENQMDINKYMMLRDVETVTVEHQNGASETIGIPEDIGMDLFKKGAMESFSPNVKPIIDSVAPNSVAEKSGIQKGDLIISVNNQKTNTWLEFNEAKQKAADNKLEMMVVRNGNEEKISAVLGEDNTLGVLPFVDIKISKKEYSIGESIVAGFDKAYWTITDYIAQFKFIFTQEGATQVGGFGAIGNLFPDAWNWPAFWETTAFISLALAFMNILPIPALDGGHIMFLMYEMVTGRKPNEKFLEYAQLAGFILLIALVLFANGNDIYRWLFK
ncbi:RIP metalloprotease RseP [Mesonia sp. K7]|uniref:RIP metalloprotease RseP n=1 Tax=Mesonia sp. K7 TaxID=2218606 RepID=UPI000DAA18BA|nr:RIP metalloprotease RseP [Mesonia sp. K7]PZD77460.1 RIP metalloprotease RseP [Mesonia sp. K7]